jgi:hypothetical protein
MGAGASPGSPARWLAGVAAVVVMWWIGFESDGRIPIVTYVNLGIHEFGHFVTYVFSDLVTALMGSIAQVAVPGALAGYFLFVRGDWVAAGICLAWGATSALEVAVYVEDAPKRELELIGGTHDWAFILGPDGYDAIERARPLAETIRQGAAAALFSGLALCVASAFRHRPHGDPTASASAATPVSSP